MAKVQVREQAETVAGSFPVRLVKAYGQSKAGNHASGLAFNAFMTMFPVMLGLLAVIGLVVRNPHAEAQVQSTLISAFPSEAHQALSTTLEGVRHRTGVLAILAGLGLLWSGSSFFAFMEFALCEMFGAKQRDFIRQRLMGVLMVAIFVVGMVVVVLANAAVSALPRLPFVGPIIGAFVMVALMTAVYRVVPNRTFALREIWRGALLAGVGIEIITLAFPLYARLMHGFNTYGAAFALFFLLATWLYLLSQLVLFGAVLNRMLLGPPRVGGLLPAEPHDSVETAGARAIDEHRAQASR